MCDRGGESVYQLKLMLAELAPPAFGPSCRFVMIMIHFIWRMWSDDLVRVDLKMEIHFQLMCLCFIMSG